jgi:hypothetical protein
LSVPGWVLDDTKKPQYRRHRAWSTQFSEILKDSYILLLA